MEKLIEEFSIGLFFWQTVIFLLLIWLLKKYAWTPILNTINDREEGIKNALESAERAREEIKTLKASNDKVLKEAKIERDNILKEASSLKKSILEEAKSEAKTEAQKIIDNANDSIKNEKEAAVSEIKKQVASLSIEIAENILKSELSNSNKQKELLNQAINENKN